MDNVWYKVEEDIKHVMNEEIVRIKDNDFRKNCEAVLTYMCSIAKTLGDNNVEHDAENISPLIVSFMNASSIKDSIVKHDRSLIKSSKTYFDDATLVNLSLITCAVTIDAHITNDKDYESVSGKLCVRFGMTDCMFDDEETIAFDKYMADSLEEFNRLKPIIDLAVQAILVAKVRFPNNIDGTQYDYMDVDPWNLDFDYPCGYGSDNVNNMDLSLWDFETEDEAEDEEEDEPETEYTAGDFGDIMLLDTEDLECDKPVINFWERWIDEAKEQRERIKIMLERFEKLNNTGTFT